MDFEEIYNAYADDVYRYVYSLCGNKHIAEDITSEAFLSAIKSIGKFKGGCSIRVWLFQIAKNAYFNYAKKSKRTTDMPDEMPSDDDFTMKLFDKSQAFEIHKKLRLLEEPYKEVFTLRTFAELSFAEIGELLLKSESWARVTYHRAKMKVREAVEND